MLLFSQRSEINMPIVNQENMLSILMNMNPWWQSGIVPKNLLKDFKRNCYFTCKKVFLNDIRRTVIMSGARRTGKTTVMYQLISDLLSSGIKPQNILFFTFDHPVIRTAGIEELLTIYKNNISDDEKFYLFIDEVDHDFCYRLVNAGFKIGISKDVVISHKIGETKVKKLLGKKIFIRNHSAFRKYYISRNIIYLSKKERK